VARVRDEKNVHKMKPLAPDVTGW